MTALLFLALAFLCGVSVGMILGAVVTWHLLRPERDGGDVDYSGGV